MDVGTLLGIGTSGPLAVLALIYLQKRKEDREDRKIDRELKSGIVETIKEILRIGRDQMAQMSTETETLRSQVAELEAQLRAKDESTRFQSQRASSTPSQLGPVTTSTRPPVGVFPMKRE